MFGRSPFAGMLSGGSMFPAIENMPGARVYSSSTEAVGQNGHFVSRSQMTRTVNGRTEVIVKQIDSEVSPQAIQDDEQTSKRLAQGNEHVTYKSPEGERYTINGVDQPSRGTIEAPRRSGSSRKPPAPIADTPANPAPTFAPPPPAAQAQAYNVPIAGPSSSRAHRHSYVPQAQTQPVQPERRPSRHSHREHRASHDDPRRTYTMPVPAGRFTFRSRLPADHRVAGRIRTNATSSSPFSSYREASSVVPGPQERERERRYTADYAHTHTPAPAPVVPEGYDTTMYRDAAPSRHPREKERDRDRDHERERRDRKLRHSRDSVHHRDTAATAQRTSVDNANAQAHEKEKEQRGWRGW